MKDLSLHILDIAQNSLKAGATRISIDVAEDDGRLSVTIRDNGCGMPPELLARAADPFATTRTTRRVGLGIPLLKMAAELTGGGLTLESSPGAGTALTATFAAGHIDAPPLGDLVETLLTLVQGAPDVDFAYSRRRAGGVSDLDTAALRAALDGVALNEPDVLAWIEQALRESEAALDGP